jgi:hypothetical protein
MHFVYACFCCCYKRSHLVPHSCISRALFLVRMQLINLIIYFTNTPAPMFIFTRNEEGDEKKMQILPKQRLNYKHTHTRE